MLQKLKKRNEGFTIIEVLIVLAIVGLIMLIVFLAVPALQRNSRNTSIKNDVQNVLGGIAEFQAANGGTMPTAVATASGTVTFSGGAGTNPVTARVQGTTSVTATAAAPGSVALGAVQVRFGNTCTAANSRAVAAYYSIETTSATVLQCVDS